MAFEELPPGQTIVIDANIFVYHFSGVSVDCTRLLERCAAADLVGVTPAHTVLEAAHRLMLLEAVTKGIVTRGDVARKLAEKPEAVMQLTEYSRQRHGHRRDGRQRCSHELRDVAGRNSVPATLRALD